MTVTQRRYPCPNCGAGVLLTLNVLGRLRERLLDCPECGANLSVQVNYERVKESDQGSDKVRLDDALELWAGPVGYWPGQAEDGYGDDGPAAEDGALWEEGEEGLMGDADCARLGADDPNWMYLYHDHKVWRISPRQCFRFLRDYRMISGVHVAHYAAPLGGLVDATNLEQCDALGVLKARRLEEELFPEAYYKLFPQDRRDPMSQQLLRRVQLRRDWIVVVRALLLGAVGLWILHWLYHLILG